MILRSPRIPWKWNGEWAPVMPRDLKLLEWRWKDEGVVGRSVGTWKNCI